MGIYTYVHYTDATIHSCMHMLFYSRKRYRWAIVRAYPSSVLSLSVQANDLLITHLVLWASWKQVVGAVYGGTQLG